MITRDHISQHLFVSVPDVRRRIGVIDRRGDEKGLRHCSDKLANESWQSKQRSTPGGPESIRVANPDRPQRPDCITLAAPLLTRRRFSVDLADRSAGYLATRRNKIDFVNFAVSAFRADCCGKSLCVATSLRVERKRFCRERVAISAIRR